MTFLIVAIATACFAQKPAGWHYDNLEGLLGPADRVFTGRVVGYQSQPYSGPNGSGQAPRPANECVVKIEVEHVYRGEAENTVILTQTNTTIPQDEQGVELLWIVQDGAPGGWTALDIRDRKDTTWRTFPSLPILSADLTPIRTKEEVLRRVASFTRSNLTPVGLKWVFVPQAITKQVCAGGSFGAYGGVVMRAPSEGDRPQANYTIEAIVPGLEALGKRLIADPQSLLPSTPDPDESNDVALSDLRVSGIQLVALFKSEQNVALLQQLLSDQTTEPVKSGSGRTFPIRKAAYQALKKWSIEVTEPVLSTVDQ